MSHARHSIWPYLATYVALLALTFATVWAADVDLGRFHYLGALGIATVKAVLVAAIFMHLRESSALNTLCIVSGAFWVFVLIGMTLGDYATRPRPPLAPAGGEPPAALIAGPPRAHD